VWRQLAADLTAKTDYYVDKGVSLTPEWIASEKLLFSATLSWDTQDYLGSNPAGATPVTFITQGRKDTVSGETANVVYTPIKALALTLAVAHLKRDSNIPQFPFNDIQATASITYKFFRYGANP
jgi:hypothetical protein